MKKYSVLNLALHPIGATPTAIFLARLYEDGACTYFLELVKLCLSMLDLIWLLVASSHRKNKKLAFCCNHTMYTLLCFSAGLLNPIRSDANAQAHDPPW